MGRKKEKKRRRSHTFIIYYDIRSTYSSSKENSLYILHISLYHLFALVITQLLATQLVVAKILTVLLPSCLADLETRQPNCLSGKETSLIAFQLKEGQRRLSKQRALQSNHTSYLSYKILPKNYVWFDPDKGTQASFSITSSWNLAHWTKIGNLLSRRHNTINMARSSRDFSSKHRPMNAKWSSKNLVKAFLS